MKTELKKYFLYIRQHNLITVRHCVLLIMLVIISLNTIAQDDDFYGPPEKESQATKKELRQKKLEKWSFGGNFWASFGSSAYVELSPIVLYRATPRLNVGVGFTYIYTRSDNYYYDTNGVNRQTIESNTYGPRAVAEFTVLSDLSDKININIGNIVLYTEYSLLETDRLLINPYSYEIFNDGRDWINVLLVGGGIYQPLGARGGVSLMLLFNVIESDYNPYENPIFRIGFFF
jgi:hypothetical protein